MTLRMAARQGTYSSIVEVVLDREVMGLNLFCHMSPQYLKPLDRISYKYTSDRHPQIGQLSGWEKGKFTWRALIFQLR